MSTMTCNILDRSQTFMNIDTHHSMPDARGAKYPVYRQGSGWNAMLPERLTRGPTNLRGVGSIVIGAGISASRRHDALRSCVQASAR
ncbi:hypothetical protein [Burkholderia lata]|uniref:hypothetical protein n=1 Tax=Burkholderia lata (strain ATCC 17760 / DSM 23089 / LMG 22485 / NCIMB 9086 / R18194 / 383) TaxID=482957 RepID=UPI002431BBD6|nr:hypothetical protein [Burkholderia lata]